MIERLLEFVDVKEGQDEALVEFIQGELITPANVRKFLEKAITLSPTTEERQAVQPILDKYHSKSLDTWKSNNLESIIEEEVVKRNPGETDEQKRIRALEQKLQAAEEKERRVRLESHAQSLASQQGLPSDLVGFFVGGDEVSTEGNIEKFKSTLDDYVQATIKSRFRDSGRNVQMTRQPTGAEIDRLKEKYQNSVKDGMKLEDRVKLARQIQDLERSQE